MSKAKLDLELNVMDHGEWRPENVVLGAVVIVKFMDTDGNIGFQILKSSDDLNIAELVGMTAMLDAYMADYIDEVMHPEDDDD